MVYLAHGHADARQQYLWWQKVIVYMTQAKDDDSATGGRISKSTWSLLTDDSSAPGGRISKSTWSMLIDDSRAPGGSRHLTLTFFLPREGGVLDTRSS